MPLRPDEEFQEYLARGSFMLQRSATSGRYFFYPRSVEPGTGNTALEWMPASGLGRVYAVTVVRPKAPAEPYNVVLIDLDEGPRLMSRVENIAADAVTINQRVRARIAFDGEHHHLVFDACNE